MIALSEPAPSSASSSASSLSPPPPQAPNRLEELQKKVSASRLNLWQSCRLKFFFRYVQQIKRPKSSSLFVGSLVHLILQHWNKARWRKEPHDVAVLKQAFELQWTEQQKKEPITWEENEEATEKNSSWSLLEMYLRHTPIPPEERPEGVEVSVEADLQRYGLPKLIGILDLVRAGGFIVDYKTAGQTPNAERIQHLHETQLSCYSVLYREATGRKEGGFELHNLSKSAKLMRQRELTIMS